MAPSVGIFYIAMVLPRHIRGKYPKVKQGVMLKVVPGDLFGSLIGGRGDRKGAKIGNMSRRKGNSALKKGRFKCTERCSVLQSAIVLIEGTRNVSGGTRNLSVCISW